MKEINATRLLLDKIISWEKDLSEYDSLESIIKQQFFVMEKKANNGYTNYEALQAEVDRLTKEKSEIRHWLGMSLTEIRTGYELDGILKKEEQDMNSPLNKIKEVLTRIK